MGVGAGLYMYVVVVQKFTFAISSPDEFLYNFLSVLLINFVTIPQRLQKLLVSYVFASHAFCEKENSSGLQNRDQASGHSFMISLD